MSPKPGSHHLLRLATGATFASALLLGCHAAPTSPVADSSGPGSMSGSWVVPASGRQARTAGLYDTGTKSFQLKAANGGTFTFGRYTLTFAPKAVVSDAKITISVSNPSIVGCELSISPSFLNSFQAPVTLTMDLTNTNVTADNIGGVSVFWQTTGGWINVGGADDPSQLTVSTNLQHFSDYRAGW